MQIYVPRYQHRFSSLGQSRACRPLLDRLVQADRLSPPLLIIPRKNNNSRTFEQICTATWIILLSQPRGSIFHFEPRSPILAYFVAPLPGQFQNLLGNSALLSAERLRIFTCHKERSFPALVRVPPKTFSINGLTLRHIYRNHAVGNFWHFVSFIEH